MTSSTKTTEPAPQSPAAKGSREPEREEGTVRAEDGNGTDAADFDRLDELARAREGLTRQVRQVAVRELLVDGSQSDERPPAERLLTITRAELLQELVREQ